MNIKTDLSFGQFVKILPLNSEGMVTAVFAVPGRVEYQVRYFDSSQPKAEYFRPHELEPIEKRGPAA